MSNLIKSELLISVSADDDVEPLKYIHGSQSVVSGSAVLASPGNFLKMLKIGLYLTPT